MIKVSYFRGENELGPTVVPLFGPADSVFEKTAAPLLLPEVTKYISELRPQKDAQYVLVNALGASEYFGSNINGDAFPEAGLIHAPDGWRGVPLYDEITARDWPYGFPTFYGAKPFLHHRNKDYAPHNHPSFGKVELAAWNDRMKRVELVCRVDKELCEKFGGIALWDKLQQGQYPDVSMGTKVPFDTCSICLDWEAYRKAQATYDKKRHRSPGEAILEVHKKKNIRGLSITRKDYCDHALKAMNRILPDGRKVFVYNDYPRFFDISFVFVGADRTAKVMMKIAGEGRSYWSMGGAELAEKMGYSDGSASDETLGEKAASAELSADQILREGFLGKSAADKEGEMTKNIPAFFAGRAAKMVAKDDVDLPKDILNLLGNTAPEEALSTASTLGVVLKPREFQRIILIRIGQKPLADEYDKKNVVFPDAEGEERVPLGTEFFNSVLMKLLLPFLSSRSGFGPMVEKRVLFSSTEPPKEKKASTSHSSDLLHKIGAAYRNYRRDMMELVATTQDFLSTAGHPSGRDLSKIASASVDEVFTPLSVAYFNDAFRDEVGSRESTVKTSGVERGSPSRNTWDTSQSPTGGQTQ